MREDTQEEVTFAVQYRILEPAAAFRVVREKSVGQRFPQGSKRDWIQFPQSRAPGEIIRGGATHALACSLASGKRICDFFKRLPDRRFRASVGSYAVHREFVRADLATPLDQAP